MQHIDVDTIIDRPVAQVFQFVARDHFQNHPKWDPTIMGIIPLSPSPIAVGSTAQVIHKQGPGTLEVTAFEPDRLLTTQHHWSVHPRHDLPPYRCECLPHAPPAACGHSSARAHPLIAPLLKPVFTRTMRKSLARIKAMVEQENEPFRNGATA